MPTRQHVALFLGAMVSYAFFFPGGGWNQNVRFAQIRSLVEAESIFIDDYLIYGRCGAQSERRLCRWPCPEQPELMGLIATACSGDLALSGDHRHVVPNKPPGITLLGLLPYALLHGSERLGGLDPDAWWLLTVNAYVVTLCTVGLAAAGGVVVVSLLAARTFPDAAPRSWLAAAVGCGLGTIYFAYATMLYDHVVVAALVATQLLLTEELWPEAATRIPLQPWARWTWAGATAGLAVACNYTALIPCGMIGLAMLGLSRDKPVTAAWFIGGGLPFALLLGAYQGAAFGSLVRLPHPAHADTGAATVAPMGGFVAPVSANPIGVYEGWFGRVFPCDSPETAWNSFNLGELCGLPGRTSLLPLLAVWAVGAAALWRTGTRREPPRGAAQSKASGGIEATSNCRGDGPAR